MPRLVLEQHTQFWLHVHRFLDLDKFGIIAIITLAQNCKFKWNDPQTIFLYYELKSERHASQNLG